MGIVTIVCGVIGGLVGLIGGIAGGIELPNKVRKIREAIKANSEK